MRKRRLIQATAHIAPIDTARELQQLETKRYLNSKGFKNIHMKNSSTARTK